VSKIVLRLLALSSFKASRSLRSIQCRPFNHKVWASNVRVWASNDSLYLLHD